MLRILFITACICFWSFPVTAGHTSSYSNWISLDDKVVKRQTPAEEAAGPSFTISDSLAATGSIIFTIKKGLEFKEFFLKVYTPNGKLVASFSNTDLTEGNRIVWKYKTADDVGELSGLLVVRLLVGGLSYEKNLMLMSSI